MMSGSSDDSLLEPLGSDPNLMGVPGARDVLLRIKSKRLDGFMLTRDTRRVAA